MSERTNKWKRRAVLFCMLAAPLALAGCGRRSLPKAPEGSTYSLEYPTRPAMGLPPLDPLHAPPKDDDEGAPAAPSGRPQPPSLRY